MKKYIIYFVAAFVALFVTSCVNDLDVEPIDPTVTTDFDQDAVFNKIYATFGLTGQTGPDGNGDVDGIDEGTSALFRMLWYLQEIPTDEVLCVWSDDGVKNLVACDWNSSLNVIQGMYGRLYFDITLCNHFLERTASASDDKSVHQRAEVRFIRALNYSYLCDLFGNVPFATKVTTDYPEQIKRADLYAWIMTELKDCEPDMYEAGAASYYRVDKTANWLLQSRMYLNAEVYTGTADWQNAEVYAKKVMDSSYDLASEYKYLFMADNSGSAVNDAQKEMIFPAAQDGVQTQSWGGMLFLIASCNQSGMPEWGSDQGWAGLRARKNLVEKFFPGVTEATLVLGGDSLLIASAKDDRTLFISQYTTDAETITCNLESDDQYDFDGGLKISKFTNLYADGSAPNDASQVDTDIPIMRKAEAYLTYAEAVTRGASAEGMTALEAVNTLRTRAHATLLPSVSLDDILDEWSREFYLEGRRRMDLVRYNRFAGSTDYNWEWKGGTFAGQEFDAFRNLYPLPNSDVVANTNLTQNEGY